MHVAVFILTRMYTDMLHFWHNLLFMQCAFNVVSYRGKPRLRTAVELLRVTQEIESRLQEVWLLALCFHFIGRILQVMYEEFPSLFP